MDFEIFATVEIQRATKNPADPRLFRQGPKNQNRVPQRKDAYRETKRDRVEPGHPLNRRASPELHALGESGTVHCCTYVCVLTTCDQSAT